jgi:hypothetical protein
VDQRETTIVPIDLGNNLTIHVEATDLGGRQKVGEKLPPLPMGDLIVAVEGVARLLVESLQRIQPSKASVEFGVEVGLEAGHLTALICKGTGKANLKIALEWASGKGAPAAPKSDG